MLPVERSTVARAGAVTVAVGAGLAATVAPAIAVLGTVGAIGALWVLSQGHRITQVFAAMLGVILVGYAFGNRAFAYVGVAPLFVGEAVLGLGALAFLYSRSRWRMTPPMAILLLFMGWGALQTFPYLPRYGVDAIRDAVAWIYALFAIFIATIVRPEQMATVVRVVRRLIPWFLVWTPIAGLVAVGFHGRLPTMPGTDVEIPSFKGGDAGVLLAGVAAFVLVGLYHRAESRPRLREPLLWIPWLAGTGVVAIVNRGGLVAISMTATALLFVRQSSRWTGLLFIITLLLVVGLLIDPQIDLGARRTFSFHQLTDNLTSIFVSTDSSLEGTKSFRLRWWGEIVDYTVNGPYFWTGKGYGVALAVVDGFNTTSAEILRSPHNGHIEMLARSGVPGLALWVVLHLTFAISMLSAAMKARREQQLFWLQVIGWLFVMWAAGLANSSFDPYLQGPQGGIWFWAVIGLGMVAIRAVHEGVPDPLADTGHPPIRRAGADER